MNPTYTIPALLSLTVHGLALAYGVSWIDVSPINLEEAPSALEICIVGAEEQVPKEKGRSFPSVESRHEHILRNRKRKNVVEEIKKVTESEEENVIEVKKEDVAEKENVENEEMRSLPIGNSTNLHNNRIGIEYKNQDAVPIINPAPQAMIIHVLHASAVKKVWLSLTLKFLMTAVLGK